MIVAFLMLIGLMPTPVPTFMGYQGHGGIEYMKIVEDTDNSAKPSGAIGKYGWTP